MVSSPRAPDAQREDVGNQRPRLGCRGGHGNNALGCLSETNLASLCHRERRPHRRRLNPCPRQHPRSLKTTKGDDRRPEVPCLENVPMFPSRKRTTGNTNRTSGPPAPPTSMPTALQKAASHLTCNTPPADGQHADTTEAAKTLSENAGGSWWRHSTEKANSNSLSILNTARRSVATEAQCAETQCTSKDTSPLRTVSGGHGDGNVVSHAGNQQPLHC